MITSITMQPMAIGLNLGIGHNSPIRHLLYNLEWLLTN